MKKIKYILLLTLCLCLSFFVTIVAGCNKQVELTLLNWQNYTDSASYGEIYELENHVLDVDGNLYKLKATVKDSKNAIIDVNYFKFNVSDYDGYEIEYSFSHGGKSYSKTVQLQVTASAPMIEIAKAELFFPGKSYAIPLALITDYIDGEIADYTVEVYKKTANGGQKVDDAISGNEFLLSELGDYYFLYTAVNSNNVTSSKTLEFSMADINDYMPYVVEVNESNASKIYYEGNSSRSKYVAKTADELKDIAGDYNGNAVKFTADYGYEGQFKVKNIYPKETLNLVAESYNSVSLWYAYDIFELAGKEGQGNLLFMENNGTPKEGEQQLVYDCFFKRANAIGTVTTADEKIWEKLTISIEDYIALVEVNNYEYFTLFGLANRNDKLDPSKSGIYISDICFENKVETVATVTKATSSIINLDNYAGHSKYLHASKQELVAIDGDYNGNAIKMLVTNAYKDRYRVNNVYTQEQLNSIKGKFNTVSMWIAYDLKPKNDGDVSVRHLAANTYGNDVLHANFFEKAGLVTTVTQTEPEWKKVSISIDDYIALLNETNFEYCVLFGLVATNVDVDNSAIYLGDIIFENITK